MYMYTYYTLTYTYIHTHMYIHIFPPPLLCIIDDSDTVPLDVGESGG